jgi:hypothetical protein
MRISVLRDFRQAHGVENGLPVRLSQSKTGQLTMDFNGTAAPDFLKQLKQLQGQSRGGIPQERRHTSLMSLG